MHDIRNGRRVIASQLNSGFASASGFGEAFKRVFGTAPSQAGDVTCLLARWIDTPLGAMLALASHEGLHLLEFVDRRGLEREIATLQRRLRRRISMRFTVPIVMMGSEFERSVWRLLQTIPAGTTRSYAQLAKTLHRPNATRAVGRANGKNCIALVIPCHRVIRADGNLCGYGGGIWRKHWLLDHERQGLEDPAQSTLPANVPLKHSGAGVHPRPRTIVVLGC